VVVTVPLEDAQAVLVEPAKTQLIFQDDVPNTVGTRLAVNLSFHMRVEEMLTQCFTTPMEHLMLDSGK